jgi:hypothetical protein
VTALAVGARVQTIQPAGFVPQPEAAGHGLDGDQAGVHGVVGVGDKLKLEPGFFLGDDCRAFSDKTHGNKFTAFCELLPHS